MDKSTLRQLIKEEVAKVLGYENFKPSKKQKDIMDRIQNITETKQTGLIKYMYSKFGDSLNLEYCHWTPELWENVGKFFKEMDKAVAEYKKPKKKDEKPVDPKMETVKVPKKK